MDRCLSVLTTETAEQLIDYETGEPYTAHTTNPVPFILVNADPAYKLREGGCLSRHRSDSDRADGNGTASRNDRKIIISKIVNIFSRNHENGSGCFVVRRAKHTAGEKKICCI